MLKPANSVVDLDKFKLKEKKKKTSFLWQFRSSFSILSHQSTDLKFYCSWIHNKLFSLKDAWLISNALLRIFEYFKIENVCAWCIPSIGLVMCLESQNNQIIHVSMVLNCLSLFSDSVLIMNLRLFTSSNRSASLTCCVSTNLIQHEVKC